MHPPKILIGLSLFCALLAAFDGKAASPPEKKVEVVILNDLHGGPAPYNFEIKAYDLEIYEGYAEQLQKDNWSYTPTIGTVVNKAQGKPARFFTCRSNC